MKKINLLNELKNILENNYNKCIEFFCSEKRYGGYTLENINFIRKVKEGISVYYEYSGRFIEEEEIPEIIDIEDEEDIYYDLLSLIYNEDGIYKDIYIPVPIIISLIDYVKGTKYKKYINIKEFRDYIPRDSIFPEERQCNNYCENEDRRRNSRNLVTELKKAVNSELIKCVDFFVTEYNTYYFKNIKFLIDIKEGRKLMYAMDIETINNGLDGLIINDGIKDDLLICEDADGRRNAIPVAVIVNMLDSVKQECNEYYIDSNEIETVRKFLTAYY